MQIVNVLKFNKTKNARTHNANEYINDNFTLILPDAIGLSLVLLTFLSIFLSTISFMMQPADRIKTEPIKKSEE